MKLDLIKKIVVEVSRIILGVTFMFSGFVKAVDPWGTAYKIEDYFLAFNLSYFSFLSFPIAAGMCVLEFLLGAFMLFGLYRFWTSRLLLLVMCFMTPLTLYLAIANPVSDCGCFGEFLIISNWSTFYKNVVLVLCAVVTVVYHNRISNIFTGKTYWLAFLFIIVFSIGFVIRNYVYEPVFDFRPYHIGANIREGMKVEEGKGRVEESILVYEKDGEEKEFTEDNFPWEDSTWVFVRMDTRVVKEGETPKIDNLSLTKLTFNNYKTELLSQTDITEEVLADTNYTFLVISPSLKKLNENYLSSVEDVEYYAKEHHYSFYCLTASVTDDIVEFVEKNSVGFDFCMVDDRVLKTMNRTNPGLLLMKDGVIVNKWADIEIPEEQDLTTTIEKLPFGQLVDIQKKDKSNLVSITILFFVPLLLLKIFDFYAFRRKKEETQD